MTRTPPLRECEQVDPEVVARVEADAAAALRYLCVHADDWPEGQEVAALIRRHRRRGAA